MICSDGLRSEVGPPRARQVSVTGDHCQGTACQLLPQQCFRVYFASRSMHSQGRWQYSTALWFGRCWTV